MEGKRKVLLEKKKITFGSDVISCFFKKGIYFMTLVVGRNGFRKSREKEGGEGYL